MLFFFFKQKTAYEMRISDWSSDVCSSDLLRVPAMPSADLPLVMDLGSQFYFKPEGEGRVWLTPHDEEPSPPCDAAPEEMAVAEAIARFRSEERRVGKECGSTCKSRWSPDH